MTTNNTINTINTTMDLPTHNNLSLMMPAVLNPEPFGELDLDNIFAVYTSIYLSASIGVRLDTAECRRRRRERASRSWLLRFHQSSQMGWGTVMLGHRIHFHM